jgi:hypothetical protein
MIELILSVYLLGCFVFFFESAFYAADEVWPEDITLLETVIAVAINTALWPITAVVYLVRGVKLFFTRIAVLYRKP